MPIKMLTNWWKGSGAQTPIAPKPQDRQYDDAPTPQGEWGMVVDKHGDPVVGRKAGGNDFIARYPMQYDYRGTIPAYDPKDYKTREEQTSAALSFAARDHRNKTLLKKAIFLLSQQDDGRELLSIVKREGFHFVFDQERMEKEGALGLCDYANKQIPLAEGRSPEEVALTVKHEMQHVVDGTKGVSYNMGHTLTSSLMADRALEANARVSESVAAVEALQGSPRGPERQFRTSALFRNFFRSKPQMAQAAYQNMALAESGQWNGFARTVFDQYFNEHGILDGYDKRQVEKRFDNDEDRGIEPPKPPDLSKPVSSLQCNRADHSLAAVTEEKQRYWTAKLDGLAESDRWVHNQDAIKQGITIRGGRPYLVGENEPDLTTAQYIGFGSEAQETLDQHLKTARLYAPERVDEIETGLQAPQRKDTEQPGQSNPFTADPVSDDFQIIALPNRHDFQGYEGSQRESHYTFVTKAFEAEYDRIGNGLSELDRISHAIEFANMNGNIQGKVKEFVNSGFRAPIAALPAEYIMHLSRIADYVCKNGGAPQDCDAEMTLINHWKELSDRGLDPIYGTEELQKGSFTFDNEARPYYESYLKPFFDTLDREKAPQAGTQNTPTVRPTSS